MEKVKKNIIPDIKYNPSLLLIFFCFATMKEEVNNEIINIIYLYMASNNDIYKSLLNQIKLEDEDENIQSKNKDVFTFNSQNDVNSVLTKILSENTSSSEVGFNNEPLTSKIKELLFSNKETCTKEIEDIFFENVENHTAVMEKILNNKDTNIDHELLIKYITYRKLNLIYLKDNLRYFNVYYNYLYLGYVVSKKEENNKT